MDRPASHQLTGPLAHLRADAAAIAAAGVAAVSPRVLVPEALASLDAELPAGPVHVLAVGKAAAAMFQSFLAGAAQPIAGSLVIAPRKPDDWPAAHVFVEGGHPIANASSVAGARLALELAASVPIDGCLVCLLSGGASALMSGPMPGLTLATKQRVVAQVMKAGGDIRALNAVRKHLSAVKGGRLAAACRGVVVTLAISDVIGDDLSVIGSGPCVPDPSTWDDALAVLTAFTGEQPPDPEVVALMQAGRAGAIPDTPKAGDLRLARSSARVIGGRAEAMSGAAALAAQLGYQPIVIDAPVAGEARTAADAWWRDAQARIGSRDRPVALVSSGETTVTVRGHGRGGRNQEFGVALLGLLGAASGTAVVASVGSDGIDGPTDAAGALVDSSSAARARDLGLDASAFLARNDSYPFLEALGDLLRPGPSDTNVGDIQVLLTGRD
ncbi:MAG: DUF4147 domain-containing protein [Acidobacteriota bacterium]